MDKTVSKIRKFLRERGWDKLMPSDVAKSISIEAAELLEVFQWDNLSIDETKKDKEQMGKLKHEIADVLIYTLYFPILLGLDAEKSRGRKSIRWMTTGELWAGTTESSFSSDRKRLKRLVERCRV